MKKAVHFKILQKRQYYRNPDCLTEIPEDFFCTPEEFEYASQYIDRLAAKNVSFCYPGHELYPKIFMKMQEPPLFLEYIGPPIWNSCPMISVVGAREIEPFTESWMKFNLSEFLRRSPDLAIVSGGARGVDQLAHMVSLKAGNPTLIILPTGLNKIYPSDLKNFRKLYANSSFCFLSEFEQDEEIKKTHFYFRNRLIAALGSFTLVTQASLRSGSMLTVHHCLQNGRPVVSVPAHPEMHGFAGNIKLLQEGAYIINGFGDLLDFWKAESSSNQT